MNALWLSRIFAYKNSNLALETAKRIIEIKIEHQKILLKKYKVPLQFDSKVRDVNSIQDILLLEARFAKKFWREFHLLLPSHFGFIGRQARKPDIVNRLLDVGYHHLANMVRKILEQYKIPMDIGLLHVPRNSDSRPLVYDLMEMFRTDVVDTEVLRFLRLKKKGIIELGGSDIPHFLHEVNKRCSRHYYLKDFKLCRTYLEYMELQILRFIKAVNHKQEFESIHLPARHESRCSIPKHITQDGFIEPHKRAIDIIHSI